MKASSRHQEDCRSLPLAVRRTLQAAELRYVSAGEGTGIRRVRRGKGFQYVTERDRPLREAELRRIKSLGIPPAWDSVWIAPDDRAHIQATGRDSRGRMQYRYHPDWRNAQDSYKYGRLVSFALRLPALRERIAADLALPGLPREKVVASAVRLLLESHIRVGNEKYARENGSYGLTTLRDHHVSIEDGRITLRFIGKAGKTQSVAIDDRRLAKVMERCRQLSGSLLFQYVDDDGGQHPIDSADINDYLRAVCGEDFSAKDVRTWAGTVMAIHELAMAAKQPGRPPLREGLRRVAERLGNTLNICRKCYVHPGVIELHRDNRLMKLVAAQGRKPPLPGLDGIESTAVAILKRIERDSRTRQQRSAQPGR